MHDGLVTFATLFLATTCAVSSFGLSAFASPHGEAPPALPGEGNNEGGGQNPRPTTVSTGVDDGVVEVNVSQPGSGGGGGPRPGPPTYTPACKWTPLRGGDAPSGEGNNPLPGAGEQAYDRQGRLGWIVSCPDRGYEVRWTTPAPDPITLVGPATDQARARLPIPVPVQSPAPDVGSFVNLGLWMSIEDPGVTTARATVAGVWAEATGTFVSFSVNPGDGSKPIPCAGFGVAYTEGSQDLEKGPCGHTYLQPSPADAPYTVTYTITYEITWRTSDGRGEPLGTYDREFEFPFDVNEIQTVGTGD